MELSPQEAEELLQATKNNQMPLEGILLQNTCGLLGLNGNATIPVMKSQISAKLGVNLNGLSLDEEREIIYRRISKIGINSSLKNK